MINPPPVRSDQEELGRRQGPSRSGTVQYGTNSNRHPETPSRQAWRTMEVPSRVLNSNAIMRDAYREDRVERSRSFRSGYVSYSRHWRDDNFWYPWWSFHWRGNCVLSPFHYYPHLPGFVSHMRVRLGDFSFGFSSFRPYRWDRPPSRSFGWGWQDHRFSELDWAVNDLVEAFENRRISYLDRIIARRGEVFIETGDGWRYSISSHDFFDMMRDLVETTRTQDYRIVDVRSTRDDALVVADHHFVDPWGYRERVRHTFLLRRDRDGYTIAYFRTDR